jgi:hypothetical protein
LRGGVGQLQSENLEVFHLSTGAVVHLFNVVKRNSHLGIYAPIDFVLGGPVSTSCVGRGRFSNSGNRKRVTLGTPLDSRTIAKSRIDAVGGLYPAQ